MDPLIDADEEGATPLTPEERDGLNPTYITLRRELNEVEQIGIADADLWAFSRKRDVLNEAFLRGLHKRMFKNVWKWAGNYRKTPRNIGIEAWRIEHDIRQLLDDVRYWQENETYSRIEIAVRFHHRLVFIHPFPNGNGRFSRLAADLLLVSMAHPRLGWGRGNLTSTSELRQAYISALRAADQHNLQPLIEFATSQTI